MREAREIGIRRAEARDSEAISSIYAPIVTDTHISFETTPPSPEEIAERIGRSITWLVHESDTGVDGYAYASPFHARAGYAWSVEVSVYLDQGIRGHGVGTALLTRLLDELRVAGYVNAFAGVAIPNPASVALFETLGFERIALQKKVGFKLGAWYDVGWWQLQLSTPSVPPPEVTPI